MSCGLAPAAAAALARLGLLKMHVQFVSSLHELVDRESKAWLTMQREHQCLFVAVDLDRARIRIGPARVDVYGRDHKKHRIGGFQSGCAWTGEFLNPLG